MAHIEERLDGAHLKRRPFPVDPGDHQLAVDPDVENLAAVATPTRLKAAARRDQRFTTRSREWSDVDFRRSGFSRHISDPTAVRRKASVVFIGCRLQEGGDLSIAGHL